MDYNSINLVYNRFYKKTIIYSLIVTYYDTVRVYNFNKFYHVAGFQLKDKEVYIKIIEN